MLPAVPVEFINRGSDQNVEGFKRDLGGDSHYLSTSKIEEKVMPSAFFAYPAKLHRSQ